jgi:hypothetical protein
MNPFDPEAPHAPVPPEPKPWERRTGPPQKLEGTIEVTTEPLDLPLPWEQQQSGNDGSTIRWTVETGPGEQVIDVFDDLMAAIWNEMSIERRILEGTIYEGLPPC